ncbi:MAG TPA: poly(3-hydroxybutyrate) depolymerase, partial [Plasticicumulans sp.]|nr:poly(3-hydroxybutyrate) depolymerase [Plasticicumulans sp.]
MPRRPAIKPLRTPKTRTLAGPASHIGTGLRRLLSGIATPAEAPIVHARAAGRWEEGSWGLGPLAQRRFRLYLPPGATRARPVPVLLLLHGCGQDSASF